MTFQPLRDSEINEDASWDDYEYSSLERHAFKRGYCLAIEIVTLAAKAAEGLVGYSKRTDKEILAMQLKMMNLIEQRDALMPHDKEN
jgi:hypothetical protein